MEESILTNKKFQFFIKLATALAFTLFVLYQTILAIQIDANRVGRLIGIGFYLMLTVASYLNFSDRYGAWVAHAVLLIAGLVLMFAMRLFNLTFYIDQLSSAPSGALNFAVYILTQLAPLVLIAGYLAARADFESRTIRILVFTLMAVVIVLYVACFVLECILLIVYRVNIDTSLKWTLLSRALYCLGYVGTAVSFVLPAPRKEEEKTGEFYSLREDEDDIDLVI